MKAIAFVLVAFCTSVALGQLNPKDFKEQVTIQVGGATYTARQADYRGGCDVGWADPTSFNLFKAIPPQLGLYEKVARVELDNVSSSATYQVDGPSYSFPLILRLIIHFEKPSDPRIGGSWPATITVR